MATVNPRVASIIAHMPGVKSAVYAEGKAIQGRAEALFAPHNRPSRHEIEGKKQDTDFLISLVGPVPIVVEFGREGYTDERGGRTVQIGPMQGLHILGRAAGL
jgi:hypothetical protein